MGLDGAVLRCGREELCLCHLAAACSLVQFVSPSRLVALKGLADGVLCCGSMGVLCNTVGRLGGRELIQSAGNLSLWAAMLHQIAVQLPAADQQKRACAAS